MTIANASLERSLCDRKRIAPTIIVRTIANHRRYSVSYSVRVFNARVETANPNRPVSDARGRDVLELRASHAN